MAIVAVYKASFQAIAKDLDFNYYWHIIMIHD